MLKKVLTGLGIGFIATFAYAQDAPTPAGGGRSNRPVVLPTQAQWDNMNAAGKAYIAKATTEAGNDDDLKFDLGVFCQASGGAGNDDRAHLGVPANEPYLAPFPAPSPAQPMPPQHLFDNMWWFGNTGVGAWVITSKDGYILFDTMDNMAEARDIIVGGMKQVGLDPTKIKYVVFGHNHLDHTGGGHYIQSTFHPKAIMGRDDWEIYFKTMEQANSGGESANRLTRRLDDKVAMTRGIDAKDGMKITVGDVTATIYQMTGHTPGSIGMIVPVKWQGKEHPILIVTAGTDVHNRESFVGGYEHIWDEGIKAQVQSVVQVHPNTNMNILARTKYLNDNYTSLSNGGKNPLLYGADRTRRYIEVMRNCTLARMEALGW
ncbi:MAG TPA: MBL fold metallo-hydrolase [Rhizomicrobium sp.]|jgi:metallo-beta-lactamase class B